MKRTILAMIIAIGMVLSIGAASAETMYLQIDKYYVENPDARPDCGKYNISIEYVGNNMTVQIIEPNITAQPDAHLKSIGLMLNNGINPVQKITLLDGTTEMKYTDDASASFGSLGDFNKNITFSFKTIGDDEIIPKPRGYMIEFLSDINFADVEEDEFKAAVHIGGLTSAYTADGEDSVKVGDGICGGGITDIPIPEFPTVALPIAAIIGLAFVMQRRKE